MKVIIAHASAGSGHLKAAEALHDYFKEQRPDIDSEIIDVLKIASPFYRSTYAQVYAWLVKYTPALWNFLFWVTHAKILRFIFLPSESWGNIWKRSIRIMSFAPIFCLLG